MKKHKRRKTQLCHRTEWIWYGM